MCPFKRVFMSPEPESSGGEGGQDQSAWQVSSEPTYCFASAALPPLVSPARPGAGSCLGPPVSVCPHVSTAQPCPLTAVRLGVSRLHGTGSPMEDGGWSAQDHLSQSPHPAAWGLGPFPPFLIFFSWIFSVHIL